MSDTVTDTPRCECGEPLARVDCLRCEGFGYTQKLGSVARRCGDCGGTGEHLVCPRCDE